MIGAALALLLAAAEAAAAQELPVSAPRPFLAAGQRLDGALASDGKSPIAAWSDPRITNAILASRVMRGRDPLDSQGIRLGIPDRHYFDRAVVATAGDTALAVLHVFGTTEFIGAARITKDGAPVDRDVRMIGYGREPAVAGDGETFAVAYATSQHAVEVKILSPQLDVVDQARFAGSQPRVVAGDGRYLVAFTDGTRLRAVTVVNGAIGREPLDIAQVSPWRPAAVWTASGPQWTAAVVNDAIEVCAVGTSGASCRKAIRLDGESYVAGIAAAGGSLLVAWYSETGRIPGDPPLPVHKPHLTRVTADGAEELSTDPVAAPSDDDILMLLNDSEAMRVGRKGTVALIPFATGLVEQRLYSLLPTGDGATAFWFETTPTLDKSDLHATRFTASGIDARMHDRSLGYVVPLGSDGSNVLLSDGRVIAPAGDVVATLTLPKGAVMAGFDGKQWVFLTDDAIVRGAETLTTGNRHAYDFACAQGACLLAWITEDVGLRSRLIIGARAMRIAADRPLKRARAQVLGKDIVEYQAIGAAAAGESLLAFWSDGRARNVQGRTFDGRGRMSKPFVVATPLNERAPLFFRSGSGEGGALVLLNGLPTLRVVRIRPDGSVIAESDLGRNDQSSVGIVRAGGTTLIYVERATAVSPYVPARRAFVVFAP